MHWFADVLFFILAFCLAFVLTIAVAFFLQRRLSAKQARPEKQ